MKRNCLILIFLFISISMNGQIENRWQPDSIYVKRNVKKIYVYLNSKKDLSQVIEFDKEGKKISSTKYSASYNRRTRKLKRIEQVSFYKYDSIDRIIEINDSIGTTKITFKYDINGKLNLSQKTMGNFKYETEHFYNPYKTITRRSRDSKIVYEKVKEYDKDFYVNRFYGYYYQPKLKKITEVIDKDTNTVAYSDYKDLIRYDDDESIVNEFDKEGKLVKSKIKSIFMNDRVNEYDLLYNYYKNGLLKSIRGDVPRYFKYEFYE